MVFKQLKDTQLINDLMAQWGANIMPEKWVCE